MKSRVKSGFSEVINLSETSMCSIIIINVTLQCLHEHIPLQFKIAQNLLVC